MTRASERLAAAKAAAVAATRNNSFGPAALVSQETASTAVAAQARAAIEARYVMALQCPRDIDDVRETLLRECDRPGFAASAKFAKPVGKTAVTGPSIRFAEAALAAYRNAYVETTAIYDDDAQRIVRVTISDLESNLSYHRDVTVRKTVERRQLRRGQTALEERTNSYGDTVYVVEATDDDLLVKEGALVSKALRTLALRLLPGWLVEEAMDRCEATMSREDAKDPDAARRRMADAFAALGVTAKDLGDYLGHPLAKTRPDELIELRALYHALKAGETTWSEIVERSAAGADDLAESLSEMRQQTGEASA